MANIATSRFRAHCHVPAIPVLLVTDFAPLRPIGLLDSGKSDRDNGLERLDVRSVTIQTGHRREADRQLGFDGHVWPIQMDHHLVGGQP